MEKNEKLVQKKASIRFSKEQLVHSARYAANRDLLNALLKDGHSYTGKETDDIIQTFYEKGGI